MEFGKASEAPYESTEEMKHLLVCATLELESARAAAKAQGQLHEARVRHLEELLKTARRERDEFRDQCKQLQERLRVSRSPSLGSGLSDGITIGLQKETQSVSSMPEPPRATLSEVHRQIQEQQHLELQQLEMQQQLQDHLNFEHHHIVGDLELDRAHEQMVLDIRSPDRQSAGGQCTDVRNTSSVNSTAWSDFPGGVQLNMHASEDPHPLQLDDSPRLHIDLPQGVSGSHLDQQPSQSLEELHGNFQQQQEQHLQMRFQLQRQESEQLLSHMQQQQRTSDSSHLHVADEQSCHSRLSEGQDVGFMQQHSAWPLAGHSGGYMQNGIASPSSSVSNLGSVSHFQMSPSHVTNVPLQSSRLQKGSAVASILNSLERFGDSPSSTLLPPRTVHLPEPPEADLQVMLKTLPEKGKLLQAVMQAGPLLQTLLLAGPLPQWRHPPPAMDSLEIPRVSMCSPSLTVPPVEQPSPITFMRRNGSSLNPHLMRLQNSMHASSESGHSHSFSLPPSSLVSGLSVVSAPLNSGLVSQRSLQQRLPMSNSHLSHDMSLFGPPLKYAKIH